MCFNKTNTRIDRALTEFNVNFIGRYSGRLTVYNALRYSRGEAA